MRIHPSRQIRKFLIAFSLLVPLTLVGGTFLFQETAAESVTELSTYAVPPHHVGTLERLEVRKAKEDAAAAELERLKAERERVRARQAEIQKHLADLRAAKARLEEAPATTAAPPSGDYRAQVLACIALHEGNPAYSNGIGTSKKYRGRYQFDQGSWNSVTSKYGFPHLTGVDVATVGPGDQDAVAWAYFLHSRYGPWPPSQGKCP